ncbi:hypothetical protein BATDEDRAFT_91050 [Batrachochytrium dendrobatidis JAM81]|uniref:Uncharacterized protein n=1 Tax=Batrachochytrium dendrobatidis (strain JAM81 / FGSC 10211) TaxID=684364 RepID=F4P9C5_BATDJ|nr:uncharacterized protein BATDEDRAFT_91050 [Batrachochytrium dendrobatidis JAM81]EGF78199.1 hypothetical protein BATDEDRAFT_91050 [Batrachochytrium dendrobatidis JAM81]|eukprot:XP_006681236.1 hypothetical protein BATDEDRAFT_91050 [Batrachochytrium dendrobatidis JAM81]
MPICLVASCTTDGPIMFDIADCESQYNVVGPSCLKPNSPSRSRRNNNSRDADSAAVYSASIVDTATHVCFDDLHDTSALPT